MAYDRFLVAPINGSLQTDLRPWLIPESSFTRLNNAYIFRGRIRKRFGEQLTGTGGTNALTAPLFSRTRIQVDTTDGAGNTTPGVVVPGSKFLPGQQFSIDDEIFTVYQLGNPAVMYDTGAATVKTFSTTTGAFVINGAAANKPVYFYPAEPIMGLTMYETTAINNEPAFAFDTQFVYTFDGTQWIRSTGIAGAPQFPVFHSTNAQFFWSTNWAGITSNVVVLFTTNYNAAFPTPTVNDDPIWAYSATPFTPATGPTPTNWRPFSYAPDITINNTGNLQPITVTQTRQTAVPGDTIASFIQSARIIVPFKDRLVMLNTIETTVTATPFVVATPTITGVTPGVYTAGTNSNFKNRCRYSHNGSPFAANAWLEPNFLYKETTTTVDTLIGDGGGFIDAPTEEAIISAEFIKDRLIVYFERSTWELAYTGNQIQPFVWQKINTELGAESTFSIVPFDKIVLGVGNVGIHACNGANVERIDNLIPDEIFQIKNKNEGVVRVAGIRDYYTEMVYWTFPSSNENPSEVFPNRLLLYNYKTGAWALADDCITTFGYFEQQSDTTWANAQGTWEEANYTWNSGVLQAQFRQVIAGNQQGYIFKVVPDFGRNAPVLSITNITIFAGVVSVTIYNHTLNTGDYILIENVQGITNINTIVYQVVFVDINTIELLDLHTLVGTYTGGGTATRISTIEITSKQLNPYVDKGRNVYLAYIDFCVVKTSQGQITVDYYPSSTSLSMINEADVNNCALGTSILETSPYPVSLAPLEQFQTRVWHRIYFQTEGEFIQFNMYLSDAQLKDTRIAFSDFEIEGFILATQPTSQRLQ